MKRSTTLAAVLLLAGCAGSTSSNGVNPALERAGATITPADMYDRIAFLASDELRGRDTPSPGLDTAAHWIAGQLASFGLEPAGEDGWFQRYPYPAVGLDTRATRVQVAAGATHTFEYAVDYFARPGTVPTGAAEVVYVGRAAPEDAGVLGRRVMLVRLRGLPEQGRRGWTMDRQARADAARAVARATAAGATGVAFVLDPAVTEADIASLAEAAAAPARVLGGPDEDAPATFFLRHAAGARILRMAGLDAAGLLDAAPPAEPVLVPGASLRLAAPHRVVDDARPPNVLGVLRGSDPMLRDTYVVVTAHMDGVGVGRPDETGDSIYNGADDDGSGTAVLIEVAEALASLEPKPRRSVLFVAVSGEEKGLLGSRWFSDHPTVPIEAMVANVNIDMVGRNAPDSIVVIGQEYSSLGPLVRRIAAADPELGLTVSEDLWPEERFFFRSDHFNFARKEIPALFFFAGTHEDYHGPGDEVDEIDTDKTARVGRLVLYLTHAIADAETPPEWDPDGLATVRTLTSQ